MEWITPGAQNTLRLKFGQSRVWLGKVWHAHIRGVVPSVYSPIVLLHHHPNNNQMVKRLLRYTITQELKVSWT